MRRRDFLKAASVGGFACVSAALSGCATVLANSAVLEDKRHVPVIDTSAALAGELEQPLKVICAASCRVGMQALLDDYHETHPNVVFPDPVYLPTEKLVDGIRSGFCDLMVVDLNSLIPTLEAEGLVNSSLRTSPFGTRLCLVTSQGAECSARSIGDLADDEVDEVVIGNGETMFTGAAANQALYSEGLYTVESGVGGVYDASLIRKITFADTVASLVDALEDNPRAVGFMAASEVVSTPGVEVVAEIMRTKYRAIRYIAAPSSATSREAYVLDFLDYCSNDDEAKRIEVRNGMSNA